MGFLPYTVESFDGSRRHTLGDFRRFKPATSAARRALLSPRTTLAVVRDADGVMVYATDGEKEWNGEEVVV